MWILLLLLLASPVKADDIFFNSLGQARIISGTCTKQEAPVGTPHTVIDMPDSDCVLQFEFSFPSNLDFDAPDDAGGLIATAAFSPSTAAGTTATCWSVAIGAVANHEDTTAANFAVTSATVSTDLSLVAKDVQVYGSIAAPLVPDMVSGGVCTNATCRGKKGYARLTAVLCDNPTTMPVDLQAFQLSFAP